MVSRPYTSSDVSLPCLHPPPILFLCAADCSAIHKGTVIASSSSSGGGHVTIPLDHAGLRYFADTDKTACSQGNMLLTVNTICGGAPPPAPPPTTKRLILVDWKVQVYGTITANLGDSLLFNWRLFNGLMEIPSRKQSQIPSTVQCRDCYPELRGMGHAPVELRGLGHAPELRGMGYAPQ